ncbi:MAG: phosphodiester glycosidase family protein [Planctomycetota bacterium]|nr:phosphodiester glycosidase family protein [Planctomycetota bacterium]
MANNRRVLWIALLLMTAAVSSVGTAAASQTMEEPFIGVRHYQEVLISPRPLFINVVEIDLSAPGLSFKVTPRGPAPQPDVGGQLQETQLQTTRAFADQQGMQVAINTSFFSAELAGWANNLGLTASNGDKYSPWQPPWDVGFDDALNITSSNQAAIVTMPGSIPTGFETNPTVPLYNTVTGSHRLLNNGTNVAAPPSSDNLTQIHPRTAVGVTSNNKLIMMTVDGRQNGFSEGVNLVELANLMQSYGATNAINLDGGGSTTMAMNYYGDTTSTGASRVTQLVNSPGGPSNVSSERAVGANLGVYAQANPYYTPHTSILTPGGGIQIADGFDLTEGRFTGGPTASGSTFGISSTSSTIDRVLNENYHANGSQRLAIQSLSNSTPGWGVRHLSSSGTPASNVSIPSSGYVGFMMKALDTGLTPGDIKVSLLMDDGSAMEQGTSLDVIMDGGWHLYQWNLADASFWNSFSGGNGQIDASNVTIDSLWVTSNKNVDTILFWDVVSFNPNGDLSAMAPELLYGDLDGDGFVGQNDLNKVLARWGTNVSSGNWVLGDPSGDGFVGQDDLNQVLGNWGQGTPLVEAVPEPTTWLLMCLAGVGLLAMRRRVRIV